jgi:glyoxylate/hydroxypyruvate reductase
MALLIDIRDPSWMKEVDLAERLAPSLPGVKIYAGYEGSTYEDVTMIAAVKLHPSVAKQLPNLRLVQKLGAGVDTMVSDPDLPSHVRLARLKPLGPAQEIAEYAVAFVLQRQRNLLFHAVNQTQASWKPIPPKRAPHTTVGVLGFGHIGGLTAKTFANLNFRVMGWSQSAKTIDGVDCCHGEDALVPLLAECDYVVSILPSTERTRDLFNAALFSKMKKGSTLINAGRGDLVVEEDLIIALANGPIEAAVLDVVRTEPLPTDHPFWTHPQITITPHVSGWHADEGLTDVAENYKRLMSDQPLLNEVDRSKGY